jgi:hypothetical protein
MADGPTLSLELCRNASTLARTLVAATRSRAPYPPETPLLVNTWQPDGRGEVGRAVVAAADPDAAGLDPLACLREL